APYVRQHPRVKINVKTGSNRETVQILLHDKVDVGLVTTPQVHERIDVVPLFEDPLVVVAGLSFAADLPPVISVAERAQLPFICYVRGARFRMTTDQVLEEMGIQPKVVMEFDNHEAIKTMVALGFGIALEPVSAVQPELISGPLVRLN